MDIIKFRAYLGTIKDIRFRKKKDKITPPPSTAQNTEIFSIHQSAFLSHKHNTLLLFEGIDALVKFQISILSNENSCDALEDFNKKFYTQDESDNGEIFLQIKLRSCVEIAKSQK